MSYIPGGWRPQERRDVAHERRTRSARHQQYRDAAARLWPDVRVDAQTTPMCV